MCGDARATCHAWLRSQGCTAAVARGVLYAACASRRVAVNGSRSSRLRGMLCVAWQASFHYLKAALLDEKSAQVRRAPAVALSLPPPNGADRVWWDIVPDAILVAVPYPGRAETEARCGVYVTWCATEQHVAAQSAHLAALRTPHCPRPSERASWSRRIPPSAVSHAARYPGRHGITGEARRTPAQIGGAARAAGEDGLPVYNLAHQGTPLF